MVKLGCLSRIIFPKATVGPHQEERPAGLAQLAIDLDAGEKLTNLVVTDCKANLC